jgi:hypothetical protein
MPQVDKVACGSRLSKTTSGRADFMILSWLQRHCSASSTKPRFTGKAPHPTQPVGGPQTRTRMAGALL